MEGNSNRQSEAVGHWRGVEKRGTGCTEPQKSTSCNGKEKIYEDDAASRRERNQERVAVRRSLETGVQGGHCRARHQKQLPAAPKKRRSSGRTDEQGPGAYGGSSLPRDSCAGIRQTGTKPGEYGEPRINQSKTKTSSAEREETTVHTSRLDPAGQETKSGRLIAEPVSVLFLLKLKSVISVMEVLSILEKLCLFL